MILENLHGKLVCPENRLDCTKADIELLYSKLPPKENCIIKDLESHNGDLFFDYKGSDGTKFAIEWDPETQSFYASPIELVKKLIQPTQGGELTNETTDTSVEPLVELFREKYVQFVNEMGRAPRVMEIVFESDDDVLRIRRNISRLAEAAIEPIQEQEEVIITPDVQIVSEEDVRTNAEAITEPDKKEESDEEPNVYVDFNPILANAAFKVLCIKKSQTEMAEELGFSRAHFNKLFLNGFKLKLQRTTVKKFKKYLTSNRQYISQLLKFDQRIMSQLTENETELLLEFLNSDGFSEEEKSNDINEVERDWKFYTFQALRLRDGEMKQETLAKEVGVSVATLGKYLNGKSTRLRRNTEIVLQKWVKAHSSKLLEHLCDEHLAKRAGLNDGDKPLLEEYLRTYLPKEPKFDSDHLEKLNSDFRPAIGIAAIKLASAADSNRGIAGEIGVLYENICNYTSGKTKRFNTEIEEKVRKWLFNNMNRLWAILQGGRYTHVLSSEESTILNEFLFKHKNYKPNKS